MSKDEQIRVAIVGTGMAGLATGYLLQHDDRRRYSVTLFERGEHISLDSASVSLRDDEGNIERVDLPMRAFAGGYYKNLKAMYDHIGVQYHTKRFLFAFEPSPLRKPKTPTTPYFIHASNNHRIPPIRPEGVSFLRHAAEIAFLAICYLWMSICFFLVKPHVAESFGQYLGRIRVPQYFVSHYLVPLMCSVSTCSHDELLAFPASDLTEYKRLTHGRDHYVVTSGVQHAQSKLSEGLTIKLSAEVISVEPAGSQVKLTWKSSNNFKAKLTEKYFDRVVLAVTPDVVARIFKPLELAMMRIPRRKVESVVLQPPKSPRRLKVVEHSHKTEPEIIKGFKTDTIAFRSDHDGPPQTESLHHTESGAIIATCGFDQTIKQSEVLHRWAFPRVLRSPESKLIVNEMFKERKAGKQARFGWQNGDQNVWLVGGWCWDGMVLLEGCLVSAVRVARDFDVGVPWRT